MTGMTRLFVLAVLLGVVSTVLFCAVAAAQEPPAPPPAVTAIDGEPPELHDVAVQLQQLHDSGKKGDEVRAICEQRLASATDPEHRAYFLWYIGRSYAKEYDYDHAITIYKQVLEQFPNSRHDWWVRYYLGRAYWDKARTGGPAENLNLAISVLTQLVQDYPSEPKPDRPLKHLAQCYEKLGDDQAALALYQKLATLHPRTSSYAWVSQVIRLRQKLGHRDEALDLLHQQATDESLTLEQRGAACLRIAEAEKSAGRVTDALATLSRIEQEIPEVLGSSAFRPAFELMSVDTLLASGEISEAENHLAALLLDCPGVYETFAAVTKVAASLAAQGSYAEAIGYYMGAASDVRFDNEWRSRAYLDLGRLYMVRLRDQSGAVSSLNSAVQLAPGCPSATEAIRCLSMMERESGYVLSSPTALPSQAMADTTGGCRDICRDEQYCSSMCIMLIDPVFISGGWYYSMRVHGRLFFMCRPKYFWEPTEPCADTRLLDCGHWDYFSGDTCGGSPYHAFTKLVAWGCDGTAP